ncbi:MAG: hypothetical protein QOF04_1622, partial [Solirubrobacteraceae bacterium]|nr:hypothetical protein [Solirubrobacteraceae bacterium]
GGHLGRQRAGEDERRADVAVEHLVVVVEGEFAGGCPARDAGVVDEDVDVARGVGEALRVGALGEVGGEEPRAPAGVEDGLDDLGAALGVAPVDDDVGAVRGQSDGDGAPDA